MLTQNKKGYWESEDRLTVHLRQPVEDVEEFGKLLFKYLQKKDVPFKYTRAYLEYRVMKADEDLEPHFNRGYLIFELKKRSLLSYLNPLYDKLKSSDTIVISWQRGSEIVQAYQERKGDLCYETVIWRIPLEQIKKLKNLLQSFADKDDVYKLILECSDNEDNSNATSS